MFSYFIILVLIHVSSTHGYWKLEWSDEFDNKSIDLSKWEVTNELGPICDGNYFKQLQCKTNRSQNLWLSNDFLMFAVITEKYLDKEYTSAMITTNKEFSPGSRFEVRASLPRGKMLRPSMKFIPVTYSGQWPKDGQMDLMTFSQKMSLGNGVHAITTGTKYFSEPPLEYAPNVNLAQFHSYIMEWNESMIVWKFDEEFHHFVNLTENLLGYDNPFKKKFKLVIDLGVGGNVPDFTNEILTKEESYDWECSLLILDYVRHYVWIEGNDEGLDNESKESVGDPEAICRAVMPSINRKYKKSKENSFPFLIVLSVCSLLLLLVLIPFTVYMFVRQKKLLNNNRMSEVYYSDVRSPDDYYEDPKYNEYYEPFPTDKNVPIDNTYVSLNETTKKAAEDYMDMEVTNRYIKQ